MSLSTSFDSFAVGNVAIFEHTFSQQDFAAFSRLSGDTNPLHHDERHALTTQFRRTIVPLHLVLAPLSRVAGMVFPGEPSLYLGHDVRAAQPVHYGEALRYSARIEAVNIANRVLTVRALALRGTEIVLDAAMRVQATAEIWNSVSSVPILRTHCPGRAVVTGASGAIGGAIALALASRGWALLLQDRGDGPRRQSLRATLARLNTDAEFVAADMTKKSDSAALAAAAIRSDDVEVLVHAASPGLDAPLEQLVAVNYSAFKELTLAVLPNMLARQKGRVLLMGSVAMVRCLPGWEDYAAAKNMAGAFAVGVDTRFSSYGVRGLVMMPGYVATPFSDGVRGNAPALLPEEVAVTAVEMIEAPDASTVLIEHGRRTFGRLGFSSPHSTGTETSRASPPTIRPDATAPTISLADIVRRVLRLPQSVELNGGGIGVTPGWDSLRQIEIILAIEADLRIQFTSAELTELNGFDALLVACQRKAFKP